MTVFDDEVLILGGVSSRSLVTLAGEPPILYSCNIFWIGDVVDLSIISLLIFTLTLLFGETKLWDVDVCPDSVSCSLGVGKVLSGLAMTFLSFSW